MRSEIPQEDDALIKIISERLRMLGLGGFIVQVTNNSTRPGLRLSLHSDISLSLAGEPGQAVGEFFESIENSIVNSKAVKHAYEKLAARVDTLSQDADDAREEVDRLKEYETHYQLQYAMQNGKANDIENILKERVEVFEPEDPK